jgi:GT2 family glycosyltransferase
LNPEPLSRAEALQRKLTWAVAAARLDLAAAEDDNRRLHAELALINRSAGRRLLVSTREVLGRAATWIRHPLWSAGTLGRHAAAVPPAAAARSTVRHLLRRAQLLRAAPSARRWTDNASEHQAISWLGPIAIRHRTIEALLCHPNSGVEYRVTVVPGARFVCECAVAPQVWRDRPSAIDFAVEIRAVSGRWTRSAEVRLDVTTRVTDRHWRALRIALPADLDRNGEDVTIMLSAAIPAGGRLENAWALFGEPRLEWTRSAAEVRRSIATFASRARAAGVRDAMRLAHGAAAAVADQQVERYARWVTANTPSSADLEAMASDAAALPVQPLISVVTPVYNTDPKWLRACVESVRRQAYPRWELCLCDDASTRPETIAVLREYESDPRVRVTYLEENARISGATNAALALGSGDFVALLDHDDELTPDALFQVAKYLGEHPDADMVYSDEDKLDLAGRRCDPYFKPDWSPEHFLTCMYTCHLMVVRRALLQRVGGFRRGYEGAQDYDLVLRLMEATERIHHIPRILYHWRKLPESTASAGQAKPWALDAGRAAVEDYVERNGIDAEVLPGAAGGLFRVRRAIAGTPLVSIVIPTAGRLRQAGRRQVDLVAACVRSVIQKTSYPHYELILVADPAGLQPTTVKALHGSHHRVVTDDTEGPFNFSRKINLGVAHAEGVHVVLFNDDLEVIASEWLSAMLEYSQQPAIGAVGAKLLYPDGRLQHVGMILGVAGIAAHAWHQHTGSSPGYSSGAVSVRNLSAVTAACLMSRREVFLEVGGFDEQFPIDFNDVDYCLRVRQAGYRIVYTPYAQLYHHESASFGPRVQDEAGAAEMRRRWGAVLDADPYYNPNLTREYPDYRIRL